MFWTLRALGHRAVSLAAFDARHSVLRPTLQIVALLGDAGWCHVMLEGGADVEAADRAPSTTPRGSGTRMYWRCSWSMARRSTPRTC